MEENNNNNAEVVSKFPLDQEIFDLISQHWTVPEVLSNTLVSKKFNELIGKSKIFQSKVFLKVFDITNIKIPGHQGRHDMHNIFNKSVREYNNFSVRADKIGYEELGVMLKNDWASAVISITEFDSTSTFIKYLSLLTPSLTSMQLSVKNIKEVCHDLKLNFSNLLKLVVSECTSSALEAFADDEINETLEELTLSAIRQSMNGMKLTKIFNSLFETFEALIQLDLGSSVAETVFDYDISEIVVFKLRHLRIDAPSSMKITKNIEKFIISQGSSLVEVCLLSWNRPETLYQIWNHMTKLVICQFRSFQENLEFIQCNQVLKKNKLQFILFDFPKCRTKNEYFTPLLRQKLESIDINFMEYEADIAELLKGIAKRIIVNGITWFNELSYVNYRNYNQPMLIDSDEEDSAESKTVTLTDSDDSE